MSYLVLARKWRPQGFDEVVGQRNVTQTLKNAIITKRLAHAFIFSGPRGVGKTTTARVLAKAINCEKGPTPEPCGKCYSCKEITDGNSVDVIEIDGASNTGVEDVRELRENVKYAPSRGRAKIYIIDEVHMLSNPAFNALLKTLEEPPSHVVFIFATTEPHKIPATIFSRCQHFDFRRIPEQEILDRLRKVTKEEGIFITDNGFSLIGRAAEGSLRDALSLLDQVVAFGGNEVRDEDLITILGIADQDILRNFSKAIFSKEPGKAITLLDDLVAKGQDLRQFSKEMTEHVRNLIMVKIAEKPDALIDLPEEDIEEMKKEVTDVPLEHLELLFNLFLRLEGDIRTSTNPRFILEMALVKASQIKAILSIDRIIKKISDIEVGLGGVSEIIETKDQKPETNKDSLHRVETPIETSAGFQIDGKEKWEKIVESVKKKNQPLGSKLEKAVFVGFDDDKLTIGFNGGATIFIDSVKKAMKKITDTAADICHREVKINILSMEGNNLAKVRMKNKDMREEVLQDPLLRKTLDIFEGKLVDVKSIKDLEEEKDGGDGG